MAEVINSQKQGVSLAGVKAAEIDPTVGTAGRTSLTAVSLDGLASAVGQAGQIKGASDSAEAKAKNNATKSQMAAAELEIQFEASKGESTDRLAEMATGYSAATGIEMTDNQKQGLAEFQALKERIDTARASGMNRLAGELALNRYRVRFLREHPELGEEALEVSGKVNSLSNSAIALANEDETNQRARVKAQVDAIYTDLANFGIPTTGLSEADAKLKWQTEISPRRMGLSVWKSEADALKAQTDLSDLQKKAKSDAFYASHVDDLWSVVAADVTSAATTQGMDAKNRAVTINGVLAGWESRLRQEAGIRTSEEFQSKFGFIMDPMRKLAEGISNGSINEEAAKNQLAYMQTVAKQKFFANNPKALAVLPIVDTFGPLLSQFARMPAYSGTIGSILTAATQDLASGNPAVGNIDITEGKGGFVKPEELSASAKRVVEIGNRIFDKPPSPESAKAVINLATSYLTSPESKRTMSGVNDIMPIIADPRFKDHAQGLDIPDEANKMVEDYVSQVNRNARDVFTKEGDNLIPAINDDGTISFGFKTRSKNAAKVKQVEADLNRAIKAYSHLHHNTDYLTTAKQFAAEIDANAQ